MDPGQQLCCESSGRRVVVDLAAGKIEFVRCHEPRRFLPVPCDRQYSCHIHEIKGAYLHKPRRAGYQMLTISTPAGTVDLTEEWSNFEELFNYLAKHVPYQAGVIGDDPNLMSVVVFGVCVGGLGGIAVNWQFFNRHQDSTLPLAMVAGALVGAVLTYLLVIFADKRGIPLVRPFLWGVSGAVSVIMLDPDGDAQITIGSSPVAFCWAISPLVFVAGFLFGMSKKSPLLRWQLERSSRARTKSKRNADS